MAIGYSATIREPCVIGFAEPVIALPLSVALQFSTQDADRIIRHECAHIGRFDDYGNLLKQLMLTVLCFNPIAFALAKALDLEREIACDDAAASVQTERADFARCLCHIALLQNSRRWLPSTGLAKNKRQLFARIGRLLDRNHATSTHLNPLARVAVAAVVLAALPFACLQFLTSDAATAASTTTVARVCGCERDDGPSRAQSPAKSCGGGRQPESEAECMARRCASCSCGACNDHALIACDGAPTSSDSRIREDAGFERAAALCGDEAIRPLASAAAHTACPDRQRPSS